jgi:hypothetical protein
MAKIRVRRRLCVHIRAVAGLSAVVRAGDGWLDRCWARVDPTGFCRDSSGAFSGVSTTVLLTVEETLAALRRDSAVGYRPPGG